MKKMYRITRSRGTQETLIRVVDIIHQSPKQVRFMEELRNGDLIESRELTHSAYHSYYDTWEEARDELEKRAEAQVNYLFDRLKEERIHLESVTKLVNF